MKVFYLLNVNNTKYYLTQSSCEYLSNLQEDSNLIQIAISITKWTDSLDKVIKEDLEHLPKLIYIEEKLHGLWISHPLYYWVIPYPKIISYEYDSLGNITLKLQFTKIVKTSNIESTIRDIKLDTLL